MVDPLVCVGVKLLSKGSPPPHLNPLLFYAVIGICHPNSKLMAQWPKLFFQMSKNLFDEEVWRRSLTQKFYKQQLLITHFVLIFYTNINKRMIDIIVFYSASKNEI